MTYLTYPVFPYSIKPLNTIKKDITHHRRFIGKTWQKEYYYYIEQEKYSASLNFNFENYEEMNKIRTFFLDRQGRAKLFWLPTWNNDLLPITEVLQGNNKIKVERSFFDIYTLIKRPLVIYLPTENFITYVTNIEEVYDETLEGTVNEISLADPLPVNLNPKECAPLQFLFLGRFKSDTATFNYIDLVRGDCSLDFEELSRVDYKRFALQVIAY